MPVRRPEVEDRVDEGIGERTSVVTRQIQKEEVQVEVDQDSPFGVCQDVLHLIEERLHSVDVDMGWLLMSCVRMSSS